MKRPIAASVLVLALSGCAVFTGSNSKLFTGRWRDVTNFNLAARNSEVWIDGKRYGVTPIAVDLDDQKGHEVSFKRTGYGDATLQLARALNGKYVIFDLIDGVAPLVVDANSQSWYLLDKHAARATLRPTSGRDDGVAVRGTLTDDQVTRLLAGESTASVISIPTVP